MPSEPKVVIVGTGGTIAGRADSATNLAYSAGQLSVADLLEAIPDLANVAQISGQNLFSLNSKDMGKVNEIYLLSPIDATSETESNL